MNTPHNLTRIIAGALLSGGVAVAGLAPGPSCLPSTAVHT